MNNIQELINEQLHKANDAILMEHRMIAVKKHGLAYSYRQSWQASFDEIRSLALLLSEAIVGQNEQTKELCDRCGTEMYTRGIYIKCPSCDHW